MNGLDLKKIDWAITTTILILLSISVAFIYSAQFQSAGSVGSTWQRQIFFGLFGLGLYTLTAWIDYRIFTKWSGWLYSIVIGMLLIVFLYPPINGAHRWITLPGFTIQPSELAKPIILIIVSAFLASPSQDRESNKTFIMVLGLIMLPLLLIAIEPDLSTALVLVPASIVILLYSGIKRKWIIKSIFFFVLFSILICVWIKFETPIDTKTEVKKEQQKFYLPEVPFLESYQKDRIRVFLSDDLDPADTGWNKLQAQVAVGSGGLRGKGYLRGTQNMLGFLPRTVAPTDFIFCVIAEEVGFMGSISVVILYLILLIRCLRSAWRASDEFGRMLALGISTLLFCHIFINIAMTIGLLPITGLPLPLMSYGGSFMISTLVSLGIIQSIYQRRKIR